MLGGHLYIGFGEMSVQVLCLFFNCYLLLLLICGSSLNILDSTLIRCAICRYFLPFHELPFCSVDCPFYRRLFLMYSYLSFTAFAFGVISKKSLPNPMYSRFPPVFSFRRFTFTS